MKQQEKGSLCCLWELDDACLLNVLKFLTPLPDLFIVGRTCWVGQQRDVNWALPCPASFPVAHCPVPCPRPCPALPCIADKRPCCCICQRFRHLICDKRMWLVVSPGSAGRPAGRLADGSASCPDRLASKVFGSIAEAVAASRSAGGVQRQQEVWGGGTPPTLHLTLPPPPLPSCRPGDTLWLAPHVQHLVRFSCGWWQGSALEIFSR